MKPRLVSVKGGLETGFQNPGRRVAPEVVGQTYALQQTDNARFREMMIRRQGPTSAAWLAFKYRRSIHRGSGFDLTIAKGETVPTWCQFAIELFEMRTDKWIVERFEVGGSRVFRIRWKLWHTNSLQHRKAARNAAKRHRKANHLKLA